MAGISFDRCANAFDRRPGLPAPLMEELLDKLAGQLTAADLVLDLGTGTGRFAIPIQAKGIRVVAVDISRRMIERARAKGGKDVFVADATALPFRDRAFDTTLAVSVLHLVASLRKTLSEIARVTRVRLVTVFESGRLYRLPRRRDGEPYDPVSRYLVLAGPPWRDYAHPQHHWGEMAQRIPPDMRLKMGPKSQLVDGSRLLALLESRAYSPQWPVPDVVHAAVVEQLRQEMAGQHFEQISEVEIIVWTPDALRTM